MSARYPYQIRIVRLQSNAERPLPKDVMTTEVVTTRVGIVAIAARFQKIYPRPGHRVLVHLLERSRDPLPVDWESLEDPDDGPR
ncbi:MAG TPA: hypothetical protein VLD15_01985 [Burkholderiales bacterium]|nr:hypothetical protein [Burkholderiales bacterium]